MTDHGIMKKTCIDNNDNTLQKLLRFLNFLYRNFYSYDSSKSARFRGTTKTQKFWNLKEITRGNFRF